MAVTLPPLPWNVTWPFMHHHFHNNSTFQEPWKKMTVGLFCQFISSRGMQNSQKTYYSSKVIWIYNINSVKYMVYCVTTFVMTTEKEPINAVATFPKLFFWTERERSLSAPRFKCNFKAASGTEHFKMKLSCVVEQIKHSDGIAVICCFFICCPGSLFLCFSHPQDIF